MHRGECGRSRRRGAPIVPVCSSGDVQQRAWRTPRGCYFLAPQLVLEVCLPILDVFLLVCEAFAERTYVVSTGGTSYPLPLGSGITYRSGAQH